MHLSTQIVSRTNQFRLFPGKFRDIAAQIVIARPESFDSTRKFILLPRLVLKLCLQLTNDLVLLHQCIAVFRCLRRFVVLDILILSAA